MTDMVQIKGTSVQVIKGDITDLDIPAFVFYAREDLKLGSGFGTAITVRGGQSIQEELDSLAPANTTDVVVSGAGELKADCIFHAVGPKFQEEETATKLKATIRNVFKTADAKGVRSLAMPPMGAGFYGVPLEECAEITLSTIREYLGDGSKLEKIVICALDNREFKPFASRLGELNPA